MKRRISVSFLTLILCLCFLFSSCGSITNEDSTSSSDGSFANAESSSNHKNDDPQKTPEEQIADITSEWRGQTLNVLATTWNSEEATIPWSQVELTVNGDCYNTDSGFGQIINNAVVLRNSQIEEKYGVKVNWISARGSQIGSLLGEAQASGSTKYHIAMPRACEAQSLVASSSIYDIASSKYIDLNESYYSQASREAYSIGGRTLFIGGDFSFIDESSAYVTYWNLAMSENIVDFPNLYDTVRNGQWTIEEMKNWARLIYKNSDEPQWTDADTYGFGTEGLVQFYQYGGINQVYVKDGQYALLDSNTNINEIVNAILDVKSGVWARTEWDKTSVEAFNDGRLLLLNDTLEKASLFTTENGKLKVGILPNPKLTAQQEKYYTPCTEKATLMCVPRVTPNREMSEAFIEVLSKTGKEHIMSSYVQTITNKLDNAHSEDNLEMLGYIFDGISYDTGYIHSSPLITEALVELYSNKSGFVENNNAEIIERARETVEQWNKSWLSYKE